MFKQESHAFLGSSENSPMGNLKEGEKIAK